MSSRRKFLRNSLLGSAGIVGARVPALSQTPQQGVKDNPIVISTWDFGQVANLEAWKTLSAGGRAVDATMRMTRGKLGHRAKPFRATVNDMNIFRNGPQVLFILCGNSLNYDLSLNLHEPRFSYVSTVSLCD